MLGAARVGCHRAPLLLLRARGLACGGGLRTMLEDIVTSFCCDRSASARGGVHRTSSRESAAPTPAPTCSRGVGIAPAPGGTQYLRQWWSTSYRHCSDRSTYAGGGVHRALLACAAPAPVAKSFRCVYRVCGASTSSVCSASASGRVRPPLPARDDAASRLLTAFESSSDVAASLSKTAVAGSRDVAASLSQTAVALAERCRASARRLFELKSPE